MKINSYGQTLSQVDTRSHPEKKKVTYGNHTICYQDERLLLQKFDFNKNSVTRLKVHLSSKITYFVEYGCILIIKKNNVGNIKLIEVKKGELYEIDALCIHAIYAEYESQVYAFSDPSVLCDFLYTDSVGETKRIISLNRSLRTKGSSTSDKRQKYWGTIETILNGNISGKKMTINSMSQSSLEYHVKKTEVYYIHSGELNIGLRTQRAENSILKLHCGDSFVIRPGTMHMRIAQKNAIIIEISTADSDADSHIVEDGMIYEHKVK